jgi:hypothetical protein
VCLAGCDLLLGDGGDQRRQELARSRQPEAAEAALQIPHEGMQRHEPGRLVEQAGQTGDGIEGRRGTGAPGLGPDGGFARFDPDAQAGGPGPSPARQPDAVSAEADRRVTRAVA